MSEPRPATPDELAALYLRARDVPCPGCGYNRRDGVAAACPECEHIIDFDNCVAPLPPAVSEAALVSVTTIGVILTLFASLILYDELRYWDAPGDVIMILAVVSMISLGVLGGGSAYRAGRLSRDRATRRTRTAIHCCCAMVAAFAFLLLLSGMAS